MNRKSTLAALLLASTSSLAWADSIPPGLVPRVVVDVTLLGADKTGTLDSAPAVNAALALGSNHTVLFPPGKYIIKSLVTSPYPLVTGQQGYHLYCTALAPCKNIDIVGYGATITTDPAYADSNWIGLDYIENLMVRGFTFEAPASGFGIAPTAFLATHLTNFKVYDISLTGNWGGSTRHPMFLAGDWLTDGEFNGIALPAMGGCFDLAFLKRVSFSNIKAVGANDAGTTTGGSMEACINIEDDKNFRDHYPSAVTYTTTDHVAIDATNDISNFANGIFIRAGSHYEIAAHSSGNPGTNNPYPHPGGAGVLVYIEDSAGVQSTYDPPNHIHIAGNLSGNGVGGTGAGAILDNTKTNAAISGVLIDGAVFDNNDNRAIKTLGPANMSNVAIGKNLYSGVSQTIKVDTNTLSVPGFSAMPSASP
jgi:hypothetical protein